MVVRYASDGVAFDVGAPNVLFELPPQPFSDDPVPWDIAPDGERFLVLESSEGSAPRDEIHITTNWFDELNRLVPTEN